MVRALAMSAPIRHRRWRISKPLPATAATSGYLTVQFTGYAAAAGGPMRGEQVALQARGG